jgi:hypothetical protein
MKGGGIQHDLFSVVGVPSIIWYGQEGDFNVMIMDRLGSSLEDLFSYCKRRFSLKTVLMIADQLVISLSVISKIAAKSRIFPFQEFPSQRYKARQFLNWTWKENEYNLYY